MKGKFIEAEFYIRKALEAAILRNPENTTRNQHIALIKNLIEQNRLIEAEFEARRIIEKSSKIFGTENANFIDSMTALSEVLLAQGRLDEAEKVCDSGLKRYYNLNISTKSVYYSNAICTYGNILVAQKKYSSAIKKYNFFISENNRNSYVYKKFYKKNPNVILALLMTGATSEAKELVDSYYEESIKLLGRNHSISAELLALRGMANNSIGDLNTAKQEFEEAIPLIAKAKTYSENRLANHRFTMIIENYLALLSKLKSNQTNDDSLIPIIDRAFEISAMMNDSELHNAVLASAARIAIRDPGLKELIRSEQDINQQIKAYQNLIKDLLLRTGDSNNYHAIKNIKSKLDKLIDAQDMLSDEIKSQIPGYANLVDHRQLAISEIREKLASGESLISIYSGDSRTYVFALSKTGPINMVEIPVSKQELEQRIFDLKDSIIPRTGWNGHLPAFDFKKAYELYSLLLKPIEGFWKGCKHLILTNSGPLSQVPFSLLITEPFQNEEEKEVMYANYRNAPWLIKSICITMVPSVSSLVALRERSIPVEAKKAFIGFGDPIFSQKQLAEVLRAQNLHGGMSQHDLTNYNIRGIRLSNDGSLDDQKLASLTIEALERLPDTADELISIANTLGANPDDDVYLGSRASEKLVKSMELSDRRTIAFASHALVPYDLDGLNQPAIALSAPAVTGEEDDGLLTMAEILDLKLNADWVILSACNTGAAEGAGAEAVSGLGRAFFYAGTRALLVSMWPVESISAKTLTTSLFRHMKNDPGLTKAQAHQRAILDLIEGPDLRDAEGRIVASYAHPFFWAPFIVVGDSSVTNSN